MRQAHIRERGEAGSAWWQAAAYATVNNTITPEIMATELAIHKDQRDKASVWDKIKLGKDGDSQML